MTDELIERVALAVREASRLKGFPGQGDLTANPLSEQVAMWIARAIIPLVQAHERERCARVADAFEADANARAYERRQEGRDDNFQCASASAAAKIAAAILKEQQP